MENLLINKDSYICPNCGLIYKKENSKIFLLCDDCLIEKEIFKDNEEVFIVCSCNEIINITEDD